MTADPDRSRRPRPARAALIVMLLLAGGCTRPEPLQPGTFTARMSGAARGEYRGEAEFCVSGSGGATLSFVSRPEAAGFLLQTPDFRPGVFRADDHADFDPQRPERYAAEAYVPDSLLAEPYVRSGSVRIGHTDSLRVEGNFALTLVPRGGPPAEGARGALEFRVAFEARPRANCGRT